MNKFIIGQRYISEMELKLGLGIVEEIDVRTVKINFPASDCFRLYSISSAPLKRVEFLEGDTIQSREGLSFKIESVSTEMEGEIDLQGLLGLDDSVSPGYEQIRMKMDIKADCSDEELDELLAFAKGHSPVCNTVCKPVPVTIERV